MPELPEVETTRRGIEPHIKGLRIEAVKIRNSRLRWPVPPTLPGSLIGRQILEVERRGKYLLFRTDGAETMIIHLGMSGSLSISKDATSTGAPGPHDHLDWLFPGGICMRLRDPRRFGAVLMTEGDPLAHPLLRHLGPEPLESGFTSDYLHATARSRRVTIKQLIMDGRVVVGVGNIYASEALFLSGIRPGRACYRVSRPRCHVLRDAIVHVLREAIGQGGTTLRDFVREDGRPGYFQQQLNVYGRSGLPCHNCGAPVRQRKIGQRSSFYCPVCQR